MSGSEDGTSSDDDAVWEMRPAGGESTSEKSEDLAAESPDEDEEVEKVQAVLKPPPARLTARQRAKQEGVNLPWMELPDPGSFVLKKSQVEDSAEAAVRKERAKEKQRLLKERQMREAQEATLSKILGADGTRKRGKDEKVARKKETPAAKRRRQAVGPEEGYIRRIHGSAGVTVVFPAGQEPYWTAGWVAAPPPYMINAAAQRRATVAAQQLKELSAAEAGDGGDDDEERDQ